MVRVSCEFSLLSFMPFHGFALSLHGFCVFAWWLRFLHFVLFYHWIGRCLGLSPLSLYGRGLLLLPFALPFSPLSLYGKWFVFVWKWKLSLYEDESCKVNVLWALFESRSMHERPLYGKWMWPCVWKWLWPCVGRKWCSRELHSEFILLALSLYGESDLRFDFTCWLF